MADDALVTQLIARVLSLEDIIDGLDARCDRSMTLAVSNRALLEDNEAKIRDVTRLVAMVAQPEDQAAEAGAPHHHAKPRGRHGLTLIRGGMAALVPLGAGLRWVARHHAHRALMWAAGISLAAVTVASAPAIATLPGAPHPHAAVVTHRHHHHRQPSVLPPMPPGAGAAPRYVGKRHSAIDDDDAVTSPSPSPDASPTAVSSPTVSPSPVVSPTVSPSPQ